MAPAVIFRTVKSAESTVAATNVFMLRTRLEIAGAGAKGTMTNVYGVQVQSPYNYSSGTPAVTIGTNYGTYIANQGTALAGSSAGLTITNAYGLYLADQSGAATLNFAIYTNAGAVSLGGNLFLRLVKSGATQAGAGAAAGEVWKTASHASLPDNVLMIGV